MDNVRQQRPLLAFAHPEIKLIMDCSSHTGKRFPLLGTHESCRVLGLDHIISLALATGLGLLRMNNMQLYRSPLPLFELERHERQAWFDRSESLTDRTPLPSCSPPTGSMRPQIFPSSPASSLPALRSTIVRQSSHLWPHRLPPD